MRYIISVLLAILFTSCSDIKVSTISIKQESKDIKKSKINSILVLPATDTTTASNLSDYYKYTITEILVNRGYYVLPVHLVKSFFASENISDAKLTRKIDIKKLKEVFDTDAILYVNISSWDSSYTLNSSAVNVELSYDLVDTSSGATIWSKIAGVKYQSKTFFHDIKKIAVAMAYNIINLDRDYIQLAYKVNNRAFENFPKGKYAESNDSTDEYIDIKTPIKEIKDKRIYVDSTMIEGTSDKQSKKFKIHLLSNDNLYSMYNLANYKDELKIVVEHSGYKNYYHKVLYDGKYIYKNRFFFYDDENKPYLLNDNNRVYIKTYGKTKKPKHKKDSNGYYFEQL